MAKLEFYRQQVVPRIATPSTRGLAAVGAQAAETAEAIARGATAFGRLAADLDELRVEDAYNKLREKQTDLMFNPTTGFSSKKAADAAAPDFISKYSGDFDKAIDEVAGSLPSNRQKDLFRRRAKMAKSEYDDSLMRHVLRETDQYRDNVYKGAISTETNVAALNWNDPAKVKDSIGRIAANTATWADRNGITGDALMAAQMDNLAAVHSAVVNAALDNGDVEYAAKYIDQNRNTIRADRLVELEGKISTETDLRASARIADDVMASFGRRMPTETEIRQKVREIAGDNVDVRDAATSEALAQLGSMQRDRRQREDDVLSAAYRQLEANGGNYAALPSSLRAAIPGDKLGTVRSFADSLRENKVRRTTDQGWTDYNRLKTNPEQLKNTDLMQFRGILGDTEFKDLVNEKANLISDPDAIIPQIDTINGMLDQRFREMGIKPTSPFVKDQVKIGKAKAILRQNLDALAMEKGRKLNATEIESVVNALFLNPVIQDSWWGDTEIKPFELTEATSPVPANQRAAIIQVLKEMNMPINEVNIYNAWRLKNPEAGK